MKPPSGRTSGWTITWADASRAAFVPTQAQDLDLSAALQSTLVAAMTRGALMNEIAMRHAAAEAVADDGMDMDSDAESEFAEDADAYALADVDAMIADANGYAETDDEFEPEAAPPPAPSTPPARESARRRAL